MRDISAASAHARPGAEPQPSIAFPPMTIYLIALMCALNHSGFGGSRVAISLYALELGVNQFSVGILMALYALSPMLLAVAIGRFADRVGPRLPMLVGTVGVGIALVLPPIFPGISTLYVVALLLGSTFPLFFVTVHGMTGDIGRPEDRARNYSLVSLGFSAAGFIGPFSAGLAIDHIGHRPAFMVLAAFTVVPALLLWLKPGFLPKGKKHAVAKGASALDLWRIPRLRNTFLASGILSAAWDLFQFYLPVYGHQIGLSASAIGAILAVFALATFIIRLILPRLSRSHKEEAIITGAFFVAAFAFALFPFFENALALAACAFVLGLGLGCGQPMSMSLIYALSPPGRAAESSGLRVVVNNVMHLVVPVAFGSLGTAFGYMPVFLSNTALLVGAGELIRRGLRTPPRS
jgi:predicted MFS family arabinose efflux permease